MDTTIIHLPFVKEHDDVEAIFRYGSKVYGVSSPTSDDDFIVVMKNNYRYDFDHIEINGIPKQDFNLFTRTQFEKLLDEHEISALECYFLPQQHVIKAADFPFQLSLPKLRKSISAKVSNSWVKTKKKLADGEFYIGKKSLWHCFRMLDFGIQIAKSGRIVDYSSVNNLWGEIVQSEHNDWEYFKEKYQPQFNARSSEFRLVAPKS